jgi:hypothetical protein
MTISTVPPESFPCPEVGPGWQKAPGGGAEEVCRPTYFPS